MTARAWVKPTFANRTIAQVANDRDRVADLLAKDMAHLSIARRRQARTIITGTIDEAVKAGKLAKHNLHDIELKDNGRATERNDFVFPAHEQIKQIAAASGIVVWLMQPASPAAYRAGVPGRAQEGSAKASRTRRISGRDRTCLAMGDNQGPARGAAMPR